MKRAYRLIRKKSSKRKKKFNIHSDKKRERVAKAANERAFPFDKRNKRNKLKREGKNKSEHQHRKASSSNNQNNSGGNKRKGKTTTSEQKEAQRTLQNLQQNL